MASAPWVMSCGAILDGYSKIDGRDTGGSAMMCNRSWDLKCPHICTFFPPWLLSLSVHGGAHCQALLVVGIANQSLFLFSFYILRFTLSYYLDQLYKSYYRSIQFLFSSESIIHTEIYLIL